MSIVYITKAKAEKIISRVNYEEPVSYLDIYKKRTFPYFDEGDRKMLWATQKFYENPESFFKLYYQKQAQSVDTMTLVYEGIPNAYHSSLNCKKLHAKYPYFPIPRKIRDDGKNAVREFRNWFKQHRHLIENGKAELFLDYLFVKWKVPSTESSLAHLKNFSNSGSEDFDNINLDHVCSEIDTLIDTINVLIKSSDKNRDIIEKFGQKSFLGKEKYSIWGNYTGYSEDEIKKILNDLDIHKNKLKKRLSQYYRIKLNPKIEIKGNLLDALGFVACSGCYSYLTVPPTPIPPDILS